MFSYEDYTITLTDAEGAIVRQWAFKEVQIDYSHRCIALLNKKGKVVFCLQPSRELTMHIEVANEDHSTYSAG
ncbi:MAG: hypothetical protein IKN55_09570 [Oscillospiraceae bacterium]|nr:hypothetical protein [Oscillospiraceae bacterium]